MQLRHKIFQLLCPHLWFQNSFHCTGMPTNGGESSHLNPTTVPIHLQWPNQALGVTGVQKVTSPCRHPCLSRQISPNCSAWPILGEETTLNATRTSMVQSCSHCSSPVWSSAPKPPAFSAPLLKPTFLLRSQDYVTFCFAEIWRLLTKIKQPIISTTVACALLIEENSKTPLSGNSPAW